jgi:hypothetical protein
MDAGLGSLEALLASCQHRQGQLIRNAMRSLAAMLVVQANGQGCMQQGCMGSRAEFRKVVNCS